MIHTQGEQGNVALHEVNSWGLCAKYSETDFYILGNLS